MYSVSRTMAAVALWVSLCIASAVAAPLRVCADPNNLPYSNDHQMGFENRIAALIAKDLGTDVEYFWFPQRSKFFKKTLASKVCDVVMGVPKGLEQAATTRPYYTSWYVFVSRRDRGLDIHSFDDPRLRSLKIGVQVLGEQDDSLPPVHALVSRGIVQNLVGFSIFGNLNEDNPAADVLKAVEDGTVDIAVVWGPLAGYFGRHSPVPLAITPVDDDPRNPDLPFQYEIAMGVRPGDTALKQTLDSELQRRRTEIENILREFGIPHSAAPGQWARGSEEE